jgi:hypothetical protein
LFVVVVSMFRHVASRMLDVEIDEARRQGAERRRIG